MPNKPEQQLESLRELVERHRFEQYYLRCGCSCSWGTMLGGSYGDWAKHFVSCLSGQGNKSAIETEKNNAFIAPANAALPAKGEPRSLTDKEHGYLGRFYQRAYKET